MRTSRNPLLNLDFSSPNPLELFKKLENKHRTSHVLAAKGEKGVKREELEERKAHIFNLPFNPNPSWCLYFTPYLPPSLPTFFLSFPLPPPFFVYSGSVVKLAGHTVILCSLPVNSLTYQAGLRFLKVSRTGFRGSACLLLCRAHQWLWIRSPLPRGGLVGGGRTGPLPTSLPLIQPQNLQTPLWLPGSLLFAVMKLDPPPLGAEESCSHGGASPRPASHAGLACLKCTSGSSTPRSSR